MKANSQGISIIAVILALVMVGAVIAIGVAVANKPNRTEKPIAAKTYPDHPAASKEQIKEAADKFLTAKVGESNFRSLFEPAPERTSFANPSDSKFDFIAYHFAGMKKYEPVDDVMMVQVNRNNLEEIYSDFAPDCKRDKTQCEFKQSVDQVTAIARDHGLTGEIWTHLGAVPESKVTRFVVVAESCNEKKAIYIDYSNGNVLASNSGCADID